MFAPKVHFKTGDEGSEVYQMLVYYSGKTMLVLLFNENYVFNQTFLKSLEQFLPRNIPAISNNLDLVISKVLGKEDPIKFFYFNQMNLALKFSNLITKDVFNLDMILLLN